VCVNKTIGNRQGEEKKKRRKEEQKKGSDAEVGSA
jgi:hypothetical protein